MGYLSPLFILTISYVIGAFIKVLFRDDDDRITESCLIGTFFVLIAWQADLLVCDYFDLNFSIAFKIFVSLLLVVFALALFLSRKVFLKKLMITSKLLVVPVIIVSVVLIVEVIGFFILLPDRSGDSSVEIVNTVLLTNSIYGFDPLTGAERVTELGLLEKLNVLPYLYAFLVKLFGETPFIMVYRCVPMWVLVLDFMAYGLWADAFFDKKERKGYEIAGFILGIGALNLCGTFSQNSIFYYLTLKGFTGEAFCFSVIIPFCIYEFFALFKGKNLKKLIYILMGGVTVVFVTTIQKGLISFLMASAICLLIALGYKLRRNIKWS